MAFRTLCFISICLGLFAVGSLRANRKDARAGPAARESEYYFGPANAPTGTEEITPIVASKIPGKGATDSTKLSVPEQSITTDIANRYGKLPLSFEINKGQTDKLVKFLSRGPGYDLFLTSTEAVFSLRRPQVHHSDEFGSALLREPVSGTPQKRSVLRLKMIDANNRSRVEGEDELPGKINYFTGNDPGNWRVNIPTYRKVHYKQIYPGVDLIYYGNRTELEYDFVVSPGGSVKTVKFQLEGADQVSQDDAGNLRLETKEGQLQLRKPSIYQLTDEGGRREVKGGYVLRGAEIGFKVQSFDHRKPLIIDPVLSYSTLLGSGGNEYAYGIAVDPQGNAYVTGTTDSGVFPTTPGAFQTSINYLGGAFVTKLDSTGSNLVYSTYLSGSSGAGGTAIAVDSSGNAYVTGSTMSPDFPSVNAIRGAYNCLKSANSGASWTGKSIDPPRNITSLAIDPQMPSTIYAGIDRGTGVYKSADGGNTWNPLNTGLSGALIAALAIDPIAPSTIYAATNTPTSGVIKSSNGGTSWVAVNNGPSSTGLIYSLAIDPVSPSTLYLGANGGLFKTTDGGSSWSRLNAFNSTAFTIAIDPTTPATVYTGSGILLKSTNGGASWNNSGTGLPNTTTRTIAIDPVNPATVFAGTLAGIFKSTNGGGNWTSANSGLGNASIASLAINPVTPAIVYAGSSSGKIFKTLDGGSNWNSTYSTIPSNSVNTLAIDPVTLSTIYAGTGTNGSTNDSEAFLTKLDPTGSALVYSTYLGGSSSDFGYGIAVDSARNAYVTGQTSSTDFLTANPFQPALSGNFDAFVTKVDSSGAVLLYSTYLGGNSNEAGYAIAVDGTGNAYVTGTTSSSNFPTMNGFQTTKGEAFTSDAFATKFNSDGTLGYSTFLGGNNVDTGYGIAVDSSGNAYVTGVTTSSNFPTANPIQSTNGGFAGDAFVTKLNSSGSALVYSTYLGGSNTDAGRGIAVDSGGNAYVTGYTSSAEFPLVAGALRTKSPFFKSSDGGASWRGESYGLKSDIATALALDPTKPSTIYTGTRNGVYKSTDAGSTWNSSSTGLVRPSVVALVVDPLTPSTVYVAVSFSDVGNSRGVYKSTNGGNSWTNTGVALDMLSVAIDPVTPATIYAGIYGNGIYKSVDGGAHFTLQGNLILSFIDAIAVDPTTPSTIYAAGNSSNGGVFKSTDSGITWQAVNNGLTTKFILSLAIDPLTPSTIYAGANGGLFKSVNGGNSWIPINTGLTSLFISALAIDPVTSTTVYAASSSFSGGLFKSVNGGGTWTQANTGLTYKFVSSVIVNPIAPAKVYAGVNVYPPDDDAFVTKINPSGTALIYSTLLGGSPASGDSSNINDEGYAIAIDSTGNAYVTGVSRSPDFPVSSNSYQPFNRGFSDAFISKLTMTYLISGQVIDAGSAPVSGAEVTLNDGTSLSAVVTESDGSYQFSRLREGGNFTVSAAKPHFTMAPTSQNFNNLTGNQIVNFVATATAGPFYTISGQVTINGAGLSGVTVALNGSQSGLRTTDNNGNYSFTVGGGGNYTVTPSSFGFIFTPANQTFNNLGANQSAGFAATRQNFVVTNANDHGAGSLRQAILDANATTGLDTITFDIPGSGVQTINLLIALPVITDPVIIDATTQPGYSGSPVVELNGASTSSGSGFAITAGGSTVRGFAINRFHDSGIALNTNGNNLIQGNYIGLDPTGTVRRANNSGISLSFSANNVIGGTTPAARNVISANTFQGITINGSGNLIEANFIGTNAAGTAGLGNGISGVEAFNVSGSSSLNNVIGGTAAGAGNLISGNQRGIQLNSTPMVIQGNLIGTDVSGTSAIGNGAGISGFAAGTIIGGLVPGARNIISGNTGDGVAIGGIGSQLQGNFIGTDITGNQVLGNGGTGLAADTNALIGGTTPEARNVVSGNGGFGNISVGSGVVVQGNYIGTNGNGSAALSNPAAGISISSSSNLIGGLTPGAQNVISGNQTGILINSGQTNTIQGNLIGSNAAGTLPLPNAFAGIRVDSVSNNNTIGGTANGAANLIAFNGGPGVNVVSGTGNSVRGNSIFSNTGLGIDLGGNGLTANDNCDADSGANNLQNFPVITSVSADSVTTTIQGTLNSTASTQFRIDLFSNATCDPSGNGEGQTFLGSTNVTTDGSCNGTFTLSIPNGSVNGTIITATATDPNSNTSEFSKCATYIPSIQFGSASYTVIEGTPRVDITLTRTGDTSAAFSVNYATIDGAGLQNCNVINHIASPRCDYINTLGTMSFAAGEISKSFSIAIVDDSYAEGNETFTVSLSGASGAALGGQATATVTIIDNDNTDGPNPIDDTNFFVRQQYIDFLGREPDPPGFAGWISTINNCSGDTTQCDRIHVSQLFFQSAEFQQRGYFVYRFYPVAFGRKPDYGEFVPDLANVSGFLDANQLEAAKVAFIAGFMARPAFVSTYNSLTNQQYVDMLLNTAGVTLSSRQTMIDDLNNSTTTRAVVLRQIVESTEVATKYNHQAYAVMEYFGYLRRQPDSFYLQWIQVLDSTNDPRGMVTGFVNSQEYRNRFGP
jgi:Calx-beta domain-containing protein/beta-propeller repeat-containing protein/carboxypeptidase family protein